AVAGVEHIGDAQTVVFRQRVNALQDLGQRVAWNGAVHAVVIGRDAAHGREGGASAGPEQGALVLVAGDPHLVGAAALHYIHDDGQVILDFVRGAVDLAQENGRRVGRITGAHEILGRADGRIIQDRKSV